MADFVGKASGKIKKLTDEQVELLFNRVNEDNEIFDSIIQCVPSGLIIVDNDFCVLKINRAAKRFIPMSYSSRDKKQKIWNYIEDKNISDFVRQTAEDNKTNTSGEFSITKSDGKIMFIIVSILPLVRKKKISGNIIFIEDVTAKKQQEILMHRMENLKSLTSLAASVAHEIKNPLGAISIHIQLMQRAVKKCRDGDGMLPDEKFLENYLGIVSEEIDNLNKIVMDFLFAVRPVQATIELVDVKDVIFRTMEFFRIELEENGIDVKMNLADDNVRLMIDQKLFREVLVNLIQNAKSAVLSKGDVSDRQIAVSSIIRNENYILTVADNGCGMESDEVSRVFEPYYTTKADGTGLGLTAVYKIVKEFSGDISVSSEKDRGTIFTISIPVPQKDTMLLASSGDKS